MNKREENFFRQLYVQYADDLFNYGRHMGLSCHDVDDIIHDIFLNIMLKSPRIGKVENMTPHYLKGYLFRSFRNKVVDIYRMRQSHTIPEGVFETEGTTNDADGNTSARELADALNKAMEKLTEPQRTALVLRYFQSFSYEDIAQAMDCTPHAARKFVSKAIASMRKRVKIIDGLSR